MKKLRPSMFLVVAVAGQALVFLCVQFAVKRPRPHVHRLDSGIPTSSYPSGHTGAATALFVGSALLVAWYVRRRWVRDPGHHGAARRAAARRDLGRLYRGAHHLSDVLAAYVNGARLPRDRGRADPRARPLARFCQLEVMPRTLRRPP